MAKSSYVGRGIVVHYDVARCIHAAECVRGAPTVFDPAAKPWIAPDRLGPDQVAAVVARCPSGALTATRADGTSLEPRSERNVATFSPSGPTYLRADFVIAYPDADESPPLTRVALCRCGQSSNKPFCDGSHKRTGFDHPGTWIAAPDEAVDAEPFGAHVRVIPKRNGPLIIEGPVEYRGADGQTFVAQKTWLCRCGQSRNKPFCDGSHKTIGFAG